MVLQCGAVQENYVTTSEKPEDEIEVIYQDPLSKQQMIDDCDNYSCF